MLVILFVWDGYQTYIAAVYDSIEDARSSVPIQNHKRNYQYTLLVVEDSKIEEIHQFVNNEWYVRKAKDAIEMFRLERTKTRSR